MKIQMNSFQQPLFILLLEPCAFSSDFILSGAPLNIIEVVVARLTQLKRWKNISEANGV
jgi:hypothetical protein